MEMQIIYSKTWCIIACMMRLSTAKEICGKTCDNYSPKECSLVEFTLTVTGTLLLG